MMMMIHFFASESKGMKNATKLSRKHFPFKLKSNKFLVLKMNFLTLASFVVLICNTNLLEARNLEVVHVDESNWHEILKNEWMVQL